MESEIDIDIKKLTSAEMAAHRSHVHTEARERISGIGGALRVSLNNMTVGSLREYIALSRHQLELSEYVNIHTGGSDDPEDLWVNKIHWPDCRYYPFQVARRPIEQNEKVLPPAWAVEQLRDVMWRVKAVGSVLGRSGKHLVATDADGITELSNHQCEIADFLRTGKFKKVPRRRKARYLGGDGTQSAETAQRVRELGEALKEYQGRIEIKTVREFIALSKHQCELAGMVIASEREMNSNRVFEVVGYHADGVTGAEAYNTAGSGLKPEPHISDRQLVEGLEAPIHEQGFSDNEISGSSYKLEPANKNCPSTARTSGESGSPGVPFCDTFGHAKVSEEILDTPIKSEYDKNKKGAQGFNPSLSGLTGESILTLKTTDNLDPRLHGGDGQKQVHNNPPYEAVPLDPDKVYDLMRMPFYPDGTIPLPVDGRWVRVDTTDGPMAMRMRNPQLPPRPYRHNDAWGEDYWDEEWEEP